MTTKIKIFLTINGRDEVLNISVRVFNEEYVGCDRITTKIIPAMTTFTLWFFNQECRYTNSFNNESLVVELIAIHVAPNSQTHSAGKG